MKKRFFFLFLSLFLFATSFAGCRQSAEAFDGFRQPFTAFVEGDLNGTGFSAEIKTEEAEQGGVMPITVTFYAPEGLCGTILRRLADGRAEMVVGATTLPLTANFSALFDLFPPTVKAEKVSLTAEGFTRVEAGGVAFFFLPDGTPYAVETPKGSIRVTRFTQTSL
ncbi:MAG: hypothetical protein E7585_03575 [Ruminococcaceae bacterium]|nr:hypothetical protein [Oscillospiraceae bacterium]